MTEEELRDRLGAWARPIESIPAPDVEVIRRRAGRRVRRAAAAVVASAAVAGLVLSVAVPRLGSAPATRTRAAGWQPAGPLPGPDAWPASAPFLVVIDVQQAGSPAVVYRITERRPRPRPVAAVRMPGRDATFTDVAAAADDRTFLLTGTSRSGRSLVTRYFELRLRPDGKIGRLAALSLGLPGPPPGGLGISALSPDGTSFAFAAQAGGPATIDVVSLATGAVRTWVAPGQASQIGSLSWADSRQLAFMWTAPGSDSPEIRLLDATATGRSLLASSRRLIAATVRLGGFAGLAYARITAAGSEVFALMPELLRPPGDPGTRLAVVAFSSRTGQPVRVIAQASQSGMGSYCGVVWADRSGRQVVTSCGYELGSLRNARYMRWSGFSFWSSLKDVPFAW
jgi:hypothetical protein